jgi:hypothetical protein
MYTEKFDCDTDSPQIIRQTGSGTAELAGLSGKMAIVIESGKHSYEFEYTL